ncbi:MAG TPA: hypothetical protein VI300_04005 [Solirubrobacter sp.]
MTATLDDSPVAEATTARFDRRSILQRARAQDEEAIEIMFRQFLPEQDEIISAAFLGTQGLWGFGAHSFLCVTDHRVAAIRIGLLGDLNYQDGALEHVNSGLIHQPSLLWLYLFAAVMTIWPLAFLIAAPLSAVVTLLLTPLILLALPLWTRLYYRLVKSGSILNVRNGLNAFVFCDRKRMGTLTRLYRDALHARAAQSAPNRTAAATRRSAPAVGEAEAARARTFDRSRFSAGVALLGIPGALALIAACFLPVYGVSLGSETFSRFQSEDKASIWLLLEPIVPALAVLGLLLAAARRRTSPDWLWIALVLIGFEAGLFAIGTIGWAAASEGLDPAIGAFVFLAGALAITASGVAANGTRASAA